MKIAFSATPLLLAGQLAVAAASSSSAAAAFRSPPANAERTRRGSRRRQRYRRTSSSRLRPLRAHREVSRPMTSVERCYEAWNRRDMDEAASCFADGFVYEDGGYLGAVTDRGELRRLFERWADLLPPGSRIVADDVASCPTTGNVGSRWHVEGEDGATVPLTRGCSFYTTDSAGGSGLITSGFKVSEMVVKPSKSLADRVVSSASKLMGASEPAESSPGGPSTRAAASIIEEYFEAWNRRDMGSALDCFVDDCTYEVEDPVFVDTFRGKAALSAHLTKNAAALPAACRIVLDDLAIDPSNGKFGVRWHLEVSGLTIPNLRGCSMYTADETTGLLRSGFDVTEAPVKFPRAALGVISLPSKLGLPRLLYGGLDENMQIKS